MNSNTSAYIEKLKAYSLVQPISVKSSSTNDS